MSVDERTRHAIHGRFEELLGPELAGAFMSYLPPVGWADVATKRDLDALEARLEARFEGRLHREFGVLRSEVGELRSEVTDRFDQLTGRLDKLGDDRHKDLRTTILAVIGTNATMAGLVIAAVRLG